MNLVPRYPTFDDEEPPALFPTAPAPECPKCGHPRGLAFVDPEYRGPSSSYPPMDGGEFLLWACRGCGYCVRTAVI